MKNLEITKRLSLIALICVGIGLLFHLVAIFFPESFVWLFARGLEAELPMSIQLILVGQTACILPFGLVSLFGYLKKNSTGNSAIGLLISAPVFYLLSGIGSSIIYRTMINFMAASIDSNGIGLLSIINSVLSLLSSVLNIASLVLICCAGSLELYITKQEQQK